MRVLFVGPVPPIPGGIAQHGARVVEQLRAEGHLVEVRSWGNQYPSLLFPGRARDPAARRLVGSSLALRWWDPLSWWRTGLLGSWQDVIVFPWVTSFHAVPYRAILAAAKGTPAVAIVHNPVPHERQPFDVRFSRWVLSHTAGAVVHAGEVADRLDRLVPGLPVRVTPHPPNLPMEPSPLPPSPPHRLLFLGFVRRYKGLDIAIEALDELVRQGRDVHLTVAGEFWEPIERFQQQVTALGLTDRVELRNRYVPDDQIPALLASHHAVVAPYRSATQSGIAPLAHAAGRPLASTDVGGLSERVVDGVTGTLSEPGDARDFARAVGRLLDDLPRYAAAARRDSASWADVTDAVVDLVSSRDPLRQPG